MAKDATVLAVYEDWAGGAGNALGTLYAYQKATVLAKSKGYDLAGKMKAGEVRWGAVRCARARVYSVYTQYYTDVLV